MDAEDFKIRSEETKRDSWEATANEMSSELSAQVSDARPIFQLYLVPKKAPKYKRPLIISTKFERLSFYNTYTIPAWKTEPISKEIVHHNSLIWLHIGNFMFKSLSHTFVHIFYASYTPEEHIFATKMVPLCVGHKFLVIVASLAALVVSMNSLHLTFYYFLNGFVHKNPWNRCKNITYYDVKLNIVINCFELDDFTRQSVNMTFDRSKHLFMNSHHEYFSLAQYEYLRYIFEQNYSFGNLSLVYYAVLWIMTALLTFCVSKKFFWKVLHYAHWTIILTNILTVLYILLRLSGFKGKREYVAPTSLTINYKYWLTDLNIIEGITTAPAFAHILSSRSTQSIEPSSDSTVIIISNATYYLFRIYLSGKMSTFCKSVIGIALDDFPYRYVFFLVWPIFFTYFYLGDLYSLIFFGFNFVAALLSSSVTFRCLIEMVIYEWKKMIKIRARMVIGVVYLNVVLLILCFSQQVLGLLCLYTIGFATLSEIIILYIFYPLGRLIDDYTFHYGEPPTRLRKLSLQVVPFYYMIKFFGLLYSLYGMRNSTKLVASQYMWCWYLTLVPLVLGMVYKIFRQHVIHKASISQLFSPDTQWGPKEFSVRKLRKQYDSRVYVKSDVPRSLSRHLLSQAEPKVYKLDVHYDVYKKHHVESTGVRFRVEKENKE